MSSGANTHKNSPWRSVSVDVSAGAKKHVLQISCIYFKHTYIIHVRSQQDHVLTLIRGLVDYVHASDSWANLDLKCMDTYLICNVHRWQQEFFFFFGSFMDLL